MSTAGERRKAGTSAPRQPGRGTRPVLDGVNPKDLIGRTKAPLRLVPAALSVYVSIVQALGAAKYGVYNWRNFPILRTVYLEAALRHILLALDGEDADPETGVPHEAHVAACMAIILDAMTVGKLVDDRHKTGKVSGLFALAKERCAEIRAARAKKSPPGSHKKFKPRGRKS